MGVVARTSLWELASKQLLVNGRIWSSKLEAIYQAKNYQRQLIFNQPYPTHLRVTAKECLLTRAKVVPALTSAPLAHPVFKWDAKGNVNPKWNSSVMDGNRVPTTEGQAALD